MPRNATPTQIDNAILLHQEHSGDEIGTAARLTLLDPIARTRYDEWLVMQDRIGEQQMDAVLAAGGDFHPIVTTSPHPQILGTNPTRLDPWSGDLSRAEDVRRAVDVAALQLLQFPDGRGLSTNSRRPAELGFRECVT